VKIIEEINSEAAKGSCARIRQVTLLSSIGVQRRNQFPFVILNLFGVLDSKAAGETALKEASKRAGFKFAIVRPGRLVGGPYTNPDFAKLLQLDEGDLRNVEMRVGDPNGFAGKKLTPSST
jgi:nucleoside-diphosphate-sugar epimerase